MVTENIANCTGCGLCAVVCPKSCLKIKLNKDGFYKPVLADSQACTRCNLCDRICPKGEIVENAEPLAILSAVTKDEQTLQTTSSGGICYEIAKLAIEHGQKVCGCIYNYDKHRAVHAVISDLDQLEATKGSKYFQSYTPDGFKDLFDGNAWTVFGTPCQIAAIAKMAERKKVRDRLTLVDFFCHGTPSMRIWDKYLSEHDRDRIAKIDFRSKEFGWGKFSLRFTYNDGRTFSDLSKNMFYTFFFSNLCLNDSCYRCSYKSFRSLADIRVGDYWGEKYKNDTKGVSCCVIMTEHGQQVLNALQERCELRPEEAAPVLKEQMTTSPALYTGVRKKVLRALCGTKSLKTIFNTTLFPYRLKCKIKSIMRR